VTVIKLASAGEPGRAGPSQLPKNADIQLALKGHGLGPCRKSVDFDIGAAGSRALSKRNFSAIYFSRALPIQHFLNFPHLQGKVTALSRR